MTAARSVSDGRLSNERYTLAMRAAGEALLEPLPSVRQSSASTWGSILIALVHGANRVAGYTRINDLRHRTAMEAMHACLLFWRRAPGCRKS